MATTEDLKNILECPVCLQVPRSSPIYECESGGHTVCKKCHPKLTSCPVCRGPMGKRRSLVSEKVLAKLPAACQFVKYGCTIEAIKDVLLQHQKECAYRMVHCVHPRFIRVINPDMFQEEDDEESWDIYGIFKDTQDPDIGQREASSGGRPAMENFSGGGPVASAASVTGTGGDPMTEAVANSTTPIGPQVQQPGGPPNPVGIPDPEPTQREVSTGLNGRYWSVKNLPSKRFRK